MYENGDIAFVYVKTDDIVNNHAIEALYDKELVIGISDAFVQNGLLHMYHAISVPKEKIKDKTIVLFRAKPTCIRQTNCEDCLNLMKNSNFDCSWCPHIKR